MKAELPVYRATVAKRIDEVQAAIDSNRGAIEQVKETTAAKAEVHHEETEHHLDAQDVAIEQLNGTDQPIQ